MVIRNYTEEAYEQIKHTIEKIDNADVNPVLDFLGDLFQRLGQFLELYKVEDYRDNMQKWYDKVLDSHNTTMSKVDRIFEDVIGVDMEYRDIMNETLDGISNFRKTLNTLREVISGKISPEDGKIAAKDYLAAGKNSLNDSFDTILTKMEKETLWNAGKEFIGDSIKLAIGFADLFVLTTPSKYAVKQKKFIDTFTATLCDSGAVVTGALVGGVFSVGSVFGLDRKKYLNFRYSQLIEAQEYKDTNSVTDWISGVSDGMTEALEECPEDHPLYPITKFSAGVTQLGETGMEIVDVGVESYDIYNDVKDIKDTISEWTVGKEYYLRHLADKSIKGNGWEIIGHRSTDNGTIIKVRGTPAAVVKDILSDFTGIPTTGWRDPSKFDRNVYKTLGTLWSYGEKVAQDPTGAEWRVDEIPDAFFGNFKNTKLIKDILDFGRGVNEKLYNDTALDRSFGVGGGGSRGIVKKR